MSCNMAWGVILGRLSYCRTLSHTPRTRGGIAEGITEARPVCLGLESRAPAVENRFS
jgi:hypothetical protein